MPRMLDQCRYTAAVVSLVAVTVPHAAAAQGNVPCRFDGASLAYEGSPAEQARCLLRQVRKGASLAPLVAALPAGLDTLVGTRVRISPLALRAYLAAHSITESEVGGALSTSLSRAGPGSSSPTARYFVIHDTSTPIATMLGPFPANMDEPSWRGNDLSRVTKYRMAHLFVSRLGKSAPGAWTFMNRLRGTKFEMLSGDDQLRGLFLHVELVQPRRSDPRLWTGNDVEAPVPGFTELQLARLALIYLAASVRKGEWLIPAFHAVIDAGIKNGHDDPQNFDLRIWAECLDALLRTLGPRTEGDSDGGAARDKPISSRHLGTASIDSVRLRPWQ